MSDNQKKAARAILGRYPTLKVALERDGETTRLIPYRASNSTARGVAVSVIHNSTPPGQITQQFDLSCRNLMSEPE